MYHLNQGYCKSLNLHHSRWDRINFLSIRKMHQFQILYDDGCHFCLSPLSIMNLLTKLSAELNEPIPSSKENGYQIQNSRCQEVEMCGKHL